MDCDSFGSGLMRTGGREPPAMESTASILYGGVNSFGVLRYGEQEKNTKIQGKE